MRHGKTEMAAGADACFEIVLALDKMLAGDADQSTAQYYAQQDAALAAFIAAAGPMPARAEGALRTLAEILITTVENGGGLEFGAFRPEAAMTSEEIAAKRQAMFDFEAAELHREASNVVPFRR